MSRATMAERREYFRKNVNPILEVMMADIMKEMPGDVTDFMTKWVASKARGIEKEIKSKNKRPEGIESSESEDDDEEEFDIEMLQKKRKQPNKARASVSAEAFGLWNKKKAYTPRVIQKSAELKARILKRLTNSFMFQALDDKQRTIVVNAMEEKKFKAGDTVIKQGDDGDVLYVLEKGSLDCSKVFSGDDKSTFLKTYVPGESFGELALLYNAPRAASIVAKEDSVMYALDRECFNNIVKDAAVKKRERYMDFLGKIEIFSTLDSYEKGKVCDCLQSQSYEPKSYIITQGEKGDSFFLIEEGQAIATKKGSSGKEEKVFEYGPNQYFGELSLLKDAPRAASIIAQTNVVASSIDRASFKRLLGPLEQILYRNTAIYEQKMKEFGVQL